MFPDLGNGVIWCIHHSAGRWPRCRLREKRWKIGVYKAIAQCLRTLGGILSIPIDLTSSSEPKAEWTSESEKEMLIRDDSGEGNSETEGRMKELWVKIEWKYSMNKQAFSVSEVAY